MSDQPLNKSKKQQKPKRFFKKTDKVPRPPKKKIPSKFNLPNISRSINEGFNRLAAFIEKHWLAIGISLITFFLLLLVIVTALDTYQVYVQKQEVENKRVVLEEKIIYWEGVIKEHQDYRDAYFQLALLQYQLGEIAKSKEYLRKVFELDPNFQKGRELEKLLL